MKMLFKYIYLFNIMKWVSSTKKYKKIKKNLKKFAVFVDYFIKIAYNSAST